jgi:hypothetical protein
MDPDILLKNEPADQENHPAHGLDGQADHPADETGEPRDQTR